VKVSLTALILWAAGFIVHAALLTVLLWRGHWKRFPIFTVLMGYNAVRTVVLASLYLQSGMSADYARAYWIASYIDLALQLGIVYELARLVFRPAGQWVQEGRKMFLLLGILGAAAAAVIAGKMHPGNRHSLNSWLEAGNLFSAMLILELVASMLFSSARLGLVGTSHVTRLVQGWSIWAIADLIAEGAFSYSGQSRPGFDYLRTGTYFCVTIYWIITLWRPEPKRRTLSPEMQGYLDTLQGQLQSELKRVSSIEKH